MVFTYEKNWEVVNLFNGAAENKALRKRPPSFSFYESLAILTLDCLIYFRFSSEILEFKLELAPLPFLL